MPGCRWDVCAPFAFDDISLLGLLGNRRLTALDIARKIGDRGLRTAELLEEAGAKTWTALLEASRGIKPPSQDDWMNVPGVLLSGQSSSDHGEL